MVLYGSICCVLGAGDGFLLEDADAELCFEDIL